MYDQVEIKVARRLIAKCDHVAELPLGINMQNREWQFGWPKGFARQMQQNSGVFADRVQQNWFAELGCRLTENMNAFRFQQVEM